ncbi:Aerotolerance protein BatB / Aerotolerance protein BatC [hydrothermal vent metagenome]|uniref:Aerotolerance protein BatB / Aerotolerance protein BatC n=1 Tax=hydrothermal vent metagenome TaxID=652676 RepID=A0A3B0Y729_9ZZZZ
MIEQLQFLRPEWFFAFIPLLLFIYLTLRRTRTSASWKTVCDPELLPHALAGGNHKTGKLPLIFTFIATALTIIALTRPVWEKLSQPVFIDTSALIIVLDLSHSMNATDLQPSRITRAKLKLQDMIKARTHGQTALIVYAADAYIVTPLTDDTNTLLNLLPTLESELMPQQGSNEADALELAARLLDQSDITHGHVLLVTDSASDAAAKNKASALLAQGHRLSVFAAGSIEGGPIPLKGGFLTNNKGAIVIPKLERDALMQLSQAGGGLYVELSNDDADIARLSRFHVVKKNTATLNTTDLAADIWYEEGPWLLLLVIPLVAIWPRRGWLVCLIMISLPITDPVYAFDRDDLWSRPNQKAQKLFNNGSSKQAAILFQQADWKASALYRAGKYAQAAALFQTLNSSDAQYNKGNALARLELYPQAIQAYDLAIKQDANNEDAIFNRSLVQQALLEQKYTPNLKPGDADENQQEREDQERAGGTPEQQDDQQNAQDQQDPQQNQQGQNVIDAEQQDEQQNSNPGTPQADESSQEEQMTDQGETETDTSQQEREQSMTIDAENTELSEQQQATEQWLKRIPDDPGGLLRRKFHYQHSKRTNKPATDKPW